MHRHVRSAPKLWNNPEWEAIEAVQRSLTPAQAVAECEHLSALYRQNWQHRTSAMVELNAILQTLRAKKVPFVLTGTHGISSWTGRPRATYDVDILVKGGRNYARAVKALRDLYPQLEVREVHGVTGYFLPGEKQSLIDVTYPHRADLRETLETAIWVSDRGQRYRVPTLEAALANKYGAMLTPTRSLDKRLLDLADFGFMVRHSTDEGRQPIDLEKLAVLGEKVWPSGGGAEILRLVEEIKAGRPPDLRALLDRRL
jgi:hypothetical protein